MTAAELLRREKEKIRAEMKVRERENLPFAGTDQKIAAHLAALPEFIRANTVFTYIHAAGETDITPAIERAFALGKTVAVPRCHKNGVMEAILIPGFHALEPGRFGILEPKAAYWEALLPEKIEFSIIPGVAFSRSDGVRLGRGGGYYDRFSAGCRGFFAGAAREYMVLEALPAEAHDLRVGAIVTESGVLRIESPSGI